MATGIVFHKCSNCGHVDRVVSGKTAVVKDWASDYFKEHPQASNDECAKAYMKFCDDQKPPVPYAVATVMTQVRNAR